MTYIVTHDGVMHADEVFSVAFLRIVFADKAPVIVRTRDKNIINCSKFNHDKFVIDVGGKYNPNLNNFDHHQEDYKGEKSSFGMVVDKFRAKLMEKFIMDDEAYGLFYTNLVKPIDDWDNNNNQIIEKTRNIHVFTLQQVISSYNSMNIYSEEQDENFNIAVDVAMRVVFKELLNSQSIYKTEKLVGSYIKAKLIEVKNKKVISKIHFDFHKKWALDNDFDYMLIPTPNSKRGFDYSVLSINHFNRLPYSKDQFFKHKNGHLALFSNWNKAYEYFMDL